MNMMPPQREQNFLLVNDLKVHFSIEGGVVRAVDGVTLRMSPGQRLCLVGESGCGKTILALAILRLLPPAAQIQGAIQFDGVNLLQLSNRYMRRVRRREIGMVFEQPTAYLNPVFPVGWQVSEAVRLSRACTRGQAKSRALRLLDLVHIPEAKKRYGQFPHQLSGGMRQRIMIAMALAKEPQVLIADEPTTALDPTVRRSIVSLLRECLDETGAACLCITHDLGVAAQLCDTAAVMYAGHILELGRAEQVLGKPRHPYSQSLRQAMDGDNPRPIPGQPPSLADLPCGCRFHPRCLYSADACSSVKPPLNGGVRCHNHH